MYLKYMLRTLVISLAMRLTEFSDYSLRVLLYLSQHNDRLATVREIAEWFGISKFHLVKVAHKLAKLGFIDSVRGKGGGLRLARLPGQVNIGDVVRQTEPDFNTVECFNAKTNTCRVTRTCRLKHTLHDATDAFLRTLDAHTLESIAAP